MHGHHKAHKAHRSSKHKASRKYMYQFIRTVSKTGRWRGFPADPGQVIDPTSRFATTQPRVNNK